MQTFKRFKGKRRAIAEEVPLTGTLWPEENGFVMMIQADSAGIDPVQFVKNHKLRINEWLSSHGACLLRGFEVDNAQAFADTVAEFNPLLPYMERAAKRLEIVPGVFTSTEMDARVVIPQHHEMSYANNWPERIYFWCQQPAAEGGQTPLTSERLVTARLDRKIREKFEKRKLAYVRNFHGNGVDLSWSDTFGTTDREEVEAYAREAGVQVYWNKDGNLRTHREGPATVTYPGTGEKLWFNHAHLFHPTNMSPAVRQSLENEFGADNLPRNVTFADGEPIPDHEIEAIRKVYERSSVAFNWLKGDLLILNNFLVTHGRQTFSGERRILVAMTDLYQLNTA